MSDVSDTTIVDFDVSTCINSSQDSSETSTGDIHNTLEMDKRRKKMMTKRKRDEAKKSATTSNPNALFDTDGDDTTAGDEKRPVAGNKKVQTTMKRKQDLNKTSTSLKKPKMSTNNGTDDPSAVPLPTINIPALLRSKEKAGSANKTTKKMNSTAINVVKNAQRVRQARKKAPLLNEAQVVRAVRAALNEQPIIILPIFLNQDQHE